MSKRGWRIADIDGDDWVRLGEKARHAYEEHTDEKQVWAIVATAVLDELAALIHERHKEAQEVAFQ